MGIKVKKSSNIVTQQDLDKINRQHINRIQEDIQKSAEADLFGTARNFFKAIVIGFCSATIAAILYGYKEPAYRKQLKTSYPFASWVWICGWGRRWRLL